MAHPLIAGRLLKLLLKVFWPWFLKHVWPLMLGMLTDLVRRNLSRTRSDLNTGLDDSLGEQAVKASARARQAEARAQAAPDERERQHQEELAQVWREVAEQYRRENEALHRRLDALLEKAQKDIAAQAGQLKPELAERDSGARLSLGERRADLPGLPRDDKEPRG